MGIQISLLQSATGKPENRFWFFHIYHVHSHTGPVPAIGCVTLPESNGLLIEFLLPTFNIWFDAAVFQAIVLVSYNSSKLIIYSKNKAKGNQSRICWDILRNLVFLLFSWDFWLPTSAIFSCLAVAGENELQAQMTQRQMPSKPTLPFKHTSFTFIILVHFLPCWPSRPFIKN